MKSLRKYVQGWYKKASYISLFIWRINIPKTLYLNFKTQRLSIAFKLPIFAYGKVKVLSLHGEVFFKGDIHPGMMKIGYKYIDLFPASLLPTQLTVNGKLVVEGPIVIGGGVHLNIERRSSLLEIGSRTTIGGGSMIKSTNKVVIGQNVQITAECVIMDSEMHFTKNINTGIVKKNYGEIIIGEYCWINQRSIISKNTILPKNSISSRGAFLNKNYTSFGENLLISGSPALVKTHHYQRIYSSATESMLDQYFRDSSTINPEYALGKGNKKDNSNDTHIFLWYR
jgi:acetyltransferase-like isoleucine patch superfamily enzyme